LDWGKDEHSIRGSYDRQTWWTLVGAWWLLQYQYDVVGEVGSIYDMNGNPISQSVQAAEAKPKYLPPLFEDREV
jgi:hypothetical protein